MSEHYGYQYAKVIITDTNYALVETISLPDCSITGKQYSMNPFDTNHNTITGRNISLNQGGERLTITLNFDSKTNKANFALMTKIKKYKADKYKNRGEKYFFLMPNSDRPYINFRCNLVTTSFDFQLLEADEFTDGYEKPVLVFETVDLVEADEFIVEFPTNPIIWVTSESVILDTLIDAPADTWSIAKLLDKSGNLNHLTGYGGSNKPIRFKYNTDYVPTNNYPTIDLKNSRSNYFKNDTISIDDFTAYMVVRQDSWVSGNCLFDGDSLNSAALKMRTGTPNINFSSNNTDFVGQNADLTGQHKIVIFATNDGSNTGYLQVNNGTANILTAGTPSAITGIRVGCSGGTAANFADIGLAELILFPVRHTAAEITTVRNYLSRKYFNTTY